MEVTIRKRKPGGGRKSNMEKNGYKAWFDKVLVAYLGAQYGDKPVEIKEPVRVHVTHKDILVSMEQLREVYREPGHVAFKKWFMVEHGNPKTGLSRAVVHSDPQVKADILDYLEANKLDEQLPDGPFDFLASARLCKQMVESRKAQGAKNDI